MLVTTGNELLKQAAWQSAWWRRGPAGGRLELLRQGCHQDHGGTLRANDAITLSVRPGEVYGLLGPNGAGKTTLVKQVIGLLKPTAGTLRLGPFGLVADPDAARQLCSYLTRCYLILAAWTAAGWVMTAWVVGRRR